MQDDLTKAFKGEGIAPLPFTTGYRHVGESNLVLAVRKPPEDKPAEPAPEEKSEPKPDPSPPATPSPRPNRSS